MAHSGRLIELRDGGIAGTARLSLSPDRRTVDVSVALDRPCDVTIGLRRLDLPSSHGEQRAENLLVVEVAPCGGSSPGRCGGRRTKGTTKCGRSYGGCSAKSTCSKGGCSGSSSTKGRCLMLRESSGRHCCEGRCGCSTKTLPEGTAEMRWAFKTTFKSSFRNGFPKV